MQGCLRGCAGRIALLGLLLGLAVAAFVWGPDVAPRLAGVLGWAGDRDSEPSAALAERTLDRFERFRAGEGGPRLAFSDAELTSVLRYALPGLLPPGVEGPTVSVRDGRIGLSARVTVATLPDLHSLEGAMGLLPDTVDLGMRGSLTPFDQSTLALHVDRVEVSHIPLPSRLTPSVLRALGRRPVRGLPDDAMAVPIPRGLETIYVLRDSLVLVADR